MSAGWEEPSRSRLAIGGCIRVYARRGITTLQGVLGEGREGTSAFDGGVRRSKVHFSAGQSADLRRALQQDSQWSGKATAPAYKNLKRGIVLAPLPATRDEVCQVAETFAPGTSDIFLSTAASEAQVKALSRSGKLKFYKYLHFATHGLLAAEVENIGEPALALSTPSTPKAEDDGLLTLSEVGQLKIDADLVILSACNTAEAATATTRSRCRGWLKRFSPLVQGR